MTNPFPYVFFRFLYNSKNKYLQFSNLHDSTLDGLFPSPEPTFVVVSRYGPDRRKYFILSDIVNPPLGLGSGLGLDSVRGSTISHKMKYLP